MDFKKLFATGRSVPGCENTLEQHEKFIAKKYGHKEFVVTRFPPEPNGHLHLGHAKALLLNLEVAVTTHGECLLRLDDTNPEAERQHFVDQITDHVTWLNEGRSLRVTHTSDYFDPIHAFAIRLIEMGKAYVCHQKKRKSKLQENSSKKAGGAIALSKRTYVNLTRCEKVVMGKTKPHFG